MILDSPFVSMSSIGELYPLIALLIIANTVTTTAVTSSTLYVSASQTVFSTSTGSLATSTNVSGADAELVGHYWGVLGAVIAWVGLVTFV